MSTYEIAPAADRDLDEIAFFIAADNPAAALALLDAAQAAFEKLAENPRLGAQRVFPGTAIPPIRAWPISGYENYIVYYRELDRGILIVRVLHGARRAEGQLEE